jgi:uroporphyrinogen decarboxylase
MSPLTPRERLRTALAHRTPDQVPLDIGGSTVTTLVDGAYERLKQHLGLPSETVYLNRRARQVVLDEAVAVRLGTDTRPVALGKPDAHPDRLYPDGSIMDEWQVVWKSAGGHYNPVGSPLAHATLSDLDQFAWPDPADPGRVRGLRDRAQALHEQSPYAVVLSLPVGVVHFSQYLRGFDQSLIDLIADEPLAAKLMDRILDIYLGIVGHALNAAGPYLDVVTFSDDLAFQDRCMVRPSVYRKLIKPRHRQIIELIKRKTHAAVLYHCCGAAYPLIPDFIDIGVDALNPVQVSAKEMGDTARLKREFGADLCFWGGIDTQHILPFGTPAQVRAETLRRIDDLATHGGYVVAAVHDIQEDVPPENILAMADAVREAAGFSVPSTQRAIGGSR